VIPLYLLATSVLALADAAASWSAWTSQSAGAEGIGWLHVAWLLVSGAFIAVFFKQGVWPGAPIAHASAVVIAGVAAAASADPLASPLFWMLRILLAAAVLGFCLATVRSVLRGEGEDYEPPAGVRGAVTAALVVAALVCFGTYGARRPARATAAAPVATPTPTSVQTRISGRVLRPDDVPLFGVAVSIEPGGPVGQVGNPVRTDRDGRFALDATTTEQRATYLLILETPGYKRKAVEGVLGQEPIDGWKLVMSPDVSP
jgi:hypothetical protein